MKTTYLIKEIREEIGVTRQEFARMIGVAGPIISYYESGKRHPSLKTIMKIRTLAKKFKIKINIEDFIWDEKDDDHKKAG